MVSTRLVGAARTEPVTSAGCLEAKGLENGLLNRFASELQDAAPPAITARTARREITREPNGSTRLRMGNSLVRYNGQVS